MISIKNIRQKFGMSVLIALLIFSFSANLVEQAYDLFSGKTDIERYEPPLEEKGEKTEKELEKEESEKDHFLTGQINQVLESLLSKNSDSDLLKNKNLFNEVISPPPEFLS